jgi:hypothetical protein
MPSTVYEHPIFTSFSHLHRSGSVEFSILLCYTVRCLPSVSGQTIVVVTGAKVDCVDPVNPVDVDPAGPLDVDPPETFKRHDRLTTTDMLHKLSPMVVGIALVEGMLPAVLPDTPVVEPKEVSDTPVVPKLGSRIKYSNQRSKRIVPYH